MLRANPLPPRRVTVKWRRVRHINQCSEPLPPPNVAVFSGSNGDCDHRPQWAVPDELELGDEPFQMWGAVIGSTSGGWSRDRFVRGVAVANRFNSDGGSIGGVDRLSNLLGHLSVRRGRVLLLGR